MNIIPTQSITRGALRLTAAMMAGLALMSTAAHGSGPGQFRYTVRFDRSVTEHLDADSAPCGVAATVTTDSDTNATVVATVGGLTDSQVVSVLDNGDPDGIIRQIHVTSTGRIVIADAVHTYRGRITQQFSGNFLPNGKYVQTGTLSVTGKSELGTTFRFNSGGHDVDDFDGVTVHFNSHQSGSGCLD